MQRASGQHDDFARVSRTGSRQAAVEGRLPRGIGVERLRDAPAEWSRQFDALDLIRNNTAELEAALLAPQRFLIIPGAGQY